MIPGTLRIQAMVDMIVDQSLLGVADRAFHGLKLLGHIHTGSAILDHPDHRSQMAFGTFQTGYDLGVACMFTKDCHR